MNDPMSSILKMNMAFILTILQKSKRISLSFHNFSVKV